MTLSFQSGTVGSPIGTPKKPGGSVGAIAFSKSFGLKTLELGWVQLSVRVSEETCAAIKQTASEQGVLLSVHAPYFINLNADEEEWPKSRKRLMDAAHYGNLAGATDIIFHPGSYFERPPAEVTVLTGSQTPDQYQHGPGNQDLRPYRSRALRLSVPLRRGGRPLEPQRRRGGRAGRIIATRRFSLLR